MEAGPGYKGPCVTKMLALNPGDKRKQSDFEAGEHYEQIHFRHDRMVTRRSYGGSSGRDGMSLN